MSERTEIEEFILRSFFEGKSITAVIRDFKILHPEYTDVAAEKKVYKVLYECAASY